MDFVKKIPAEKDMVIELYWNKIKGQIGLQGPSAKKNSQRPEA